MYSRFISAVSAARQPSLIREMTQVLKIPPLKLSSFPSQILASAPPEMIPLSGGFPNPQMFPFKQLTLEVSGGDPIVLQGKGLQVNYISLAIAQTHYCHCPSSLLPLHQLVILCHCPNIRQPCNTSPPLATPACYSNFDNCRKKPIHLIR